jgi:hypothetical protein
MPDRETMTRHQRVGASLLSVLLSVYVVGIFFGAGSSQGIANRIFGGPIYLFMFGSPFCLAGWAVSLPIIFRIRSIDGWRFWALLALGSCIGPFIIFSVGICFEISAVIEKISSPNWDPIVHTYVYDAMAISFLSTLIYLSIARRNENRSRTSTTKST